MFLPVLDFASTTSSVDTLALPPITELLRLFMGRGDGWADPFGGSNNPAQHQNGVNGRHHGQAAEFLGRFPDEALQGVILDQTCRQLKINEGCEGMAVANNESDASFIGQMKDVAAKKIMPGGLAVCCGLNSIGLGQERGFELIQVLTVRHGGDHNDTVVTVEIKVPYQAADDPTADDLAALRSQDRRRGRASRAAPARGGPRHDLQRAELLAVKDVAVLASLSESYLRRKIYSRELPATNIGTEARPVWRISRKDLVAWLEARKGGTPSIPPKSQLRDLIERHLPGL